MKALANLDLYKGIILVSLLVLPAAGWWIWSLDKSIQATKAAIHEATRAGGVLEQIGELQEKAQIVVANNTLTGDATSRHGVYFDAQIKAVAPGKIATDAFSISQPEETGARLGGKQQVTDFNVKITWGKGGRDNPVSLEFLYALLFNCESGARTDVRDSSRIQSIWKLRQLSFQNVAYQTYAQGGVKRTPKEPELQDLWQISDLVFARREPKKDKRAE